MTREMPTKEDLIYMQIRDLIFKLAKDKKGFNKVMRELKAYMGVYYEESDMCRIPYPHDFPDYPCEKCNFKGEIK